MATNENTRLESVQFEDHSLKIINHNGQQWLTGPDIARALGMGRSDNVSRIYGRFKKEFDGTMTHTVNLTGWDGNVHKNRIYSRRGAHLIAMLSRTPRAAAFRKWVLDVLEGQGEAVPIPVPADSKQPDPEVLKKEYARGVTAGLAAGAEWQDIQQEKEKIGSREARLLEKLGLAPALAPKPRKGFRPVKHDLYSQPLIMKGVGR